MNYNPSNWYWIVNGSTTEVWSSARSAYVPPTDATYTAWLAAGGAPTQIHNAAELAEVLAAQWQPGYLAAGVTLTSTATPALNGVYAADQGTLSEITAISTGINAGKPLPGAGSTFNWPNAGGTQIAFTGTNFLNFAYAVEGVVYEIEQAIGTLVNGGTVALPGLSLAIP